MTAVASTPIVQGWCPGAHKPMMSGDGLVVRVRPFRATLSRDQVYALCDLSREFGNGTLDLTTRANLQIRGVDEADHPKLLQSLNDLGLLDADPSVEGHRNILMAPDWQKGDLTDRLYSALLTALPTLPNLPEKMGYALDTGAQGRLAAGSADFRFELDDTGHLILRADGAPAGRRVDETMVIDALTELIAWFVDTGGKGAGRMARHLKSVTMPDTWQDAAPRAQGPAFEPGNTDDGLILGAPFGSIRSDDLETLITNAGITEMRLMLDRLFWLRGARPAAIKGFVTTPGSPLLNTHACPGAPYCPQATVETRELAERLAGQTTGTLHVSGCAKGCALPRRAEFTLVGRDHRFDLVRNGTPWEKPAASGLIPNDIHDLTGIT